ncbi:MAG: TetR/AcrR family transcriptional regulator [Acidobacteria bacterium]|nr:TetR/AcrR family transcriptional regulator [Acidobacteriota bacterium]
MNEKKLSRRERLKASNYREILEAAQELFTANGYHNVTMNQIAEKAEFSIGTLYNFFKNKEDLYHSLILEKLKEFSEIQFLTLDKDLPVLQRIGEFIDNAIRFFGDHIPFIRIFFAETRGESHNLRSRLRHDARKIMNEIDERIASVMEEGVQKKIFRKLDPFHLALTLQGICQAFLFHSMEYPEQYPEGLKAEIIFNLFTRGALADVSNLDHAMDAE